MTVVNIVYILELIQAYRGRFRLWITLMLVIWTGSYSAVYADTEARAISDLLQAGEYLTALNILEDLKAARRCDPELLFLEARTYETVGETERAVILYRSLINMFPNFPSPYNNLAGLYAASGDLNNAEALLLQGLSTNAVYQQIQRNLSKVYIARAASLYRKALGINASSDSLEIRSVGIQLSNIPKLYQFQDPDHKLSKSKCEQEDPS